MTQILSPNQERNEEQSQTKNETQCETGVGFGGLYLKNEADCDKAWKVYRQCLPSEILKVISKPEALLSETLAHLQGWAKLNIASTGQREKNSEALSESVENVTRRIARTTFACRFARLLLKSRLEICAADILRSDTFSPDNVTLADRNGAAASGVCDGSPLAPLLTATLTVLDVGYQAAARGDAPTASMAAFNPCQIKLSESSVDDTEVEHRLVSLELSLLQLATTLLRVHNFQAGDRESGDFPTVLAEFKLGQNCGQQLRVIASKAAEEIENLKPRSWLPAWLSNPLSRSLSRSDSKISIEGGGLSSNSGEQTPANGRELTIPDLRSQSLLCLLGLVSQLATRHHALDRTSNRHPLSESSDSGADGGSCSGSVSGVMDRKKAWIPVTFASRKEAEGVFTPLVDYLGSLVDVYVDAMKLQLDTTEESPAPLTEGSVEGKLITRKLAIFLLFLWTLHSQTLSDMYLAREIAVQAPRLLKALIDLLSLPPVPRQRRRSFSGSAHIKELKNPSPVQQHFLFLPVREHHSLVLKLAAMLLTNMLSSRANSLALEKESSWDLITHLPPNLADRLVLALGIHFAHHHGNTNDRSTEAEHPEQLAPSKELCLRQLTPCELLSAAFLNAAPYIRGKAGLSFSAANALATILCQRWSSFTLSSKTPLQSPRQRAQANVLEAVALILQYGSDANGPLLLSLVKYHVHIVLRCLAICGPDLWPLRTGHGRKSSQLETSRGCISCDRNGGTAATPLPKPGGDEVSKGADRLIAERLTGHCTPRPLPIEPPTHAHTHTPTHAHTHSHTDHSGQSSTAQEAALTMLLFLETATPILAPYCQEADVLDSDDAVLSARTICLVGVLPQPPKLRARVFEPRSELLEWLSEFVDEA